MNFKLLRPREAFERELLFRSLDAIGVVNLDRYVPTYDIEVEGGDDEDVLEAMFTRLNIDHPADFRQHSMSVGDIVMLDRSRLYFCDSHGWVALTGENAPAAKAPLVLDVGGRKAR